MIGIEIVKDKETKEPSKRIDSKDTVEIFQKGTYSLENWPLR